VSMETLRDATILIVDDEPGNIELLEDCLADEGYRNVHSTRFPDQAVDLFDSIHPDLVLLDLHMPQLDGFAVLRLLTERIPPASYLPVLVLTADVTAEARQRALSSGAKDFVSKPLDITEVLLRIHNLLQTRHLYLEEKSAREAAEAAARRTTFLAEVSRILSSSFDAETNLAALVRLAVPEMADSCTVELAREGGDLVRLAFAHIGAAEEATFRDGGPPREARAPETGLADPGSTIRAPLDVSGKKLGVLTLSFTESGRQYGPEDGVLAEEVGRRTALALENARLFQAAQEATRARDDVLRVVAHDLRNPLGAIKLANDYLRELVGREEALNMVGIIGRSAAQMNRLIEDLLEAARLENGRLTLDVQPSSVAELMEEVDAVLGSLASSRSILLETKIRGRIPRVHMDAPRILQVISNLVGNAIKFTPANGRIRVQCAAEGGEVRFDVSDTGKGISKEQLPNVFRRFWQADERDRRGVGLGLSVARGIVEAHGGRIWVESGEGEGSTFHFTLPLTSDHPEVTVSLPETQREPSPVTA